MLMSPNQRATSVMDRISRVLFPGIHRVRRRTHMRFLLLSIGLALVFCFLLAAALWMTNHARG